MAELLMRGPLFPGKNDKDQMDKVSHTLCVCIFMMSMCIVLVTHHIKVFELCGTPNDDIWPGCSALPYYNLVQKPEKERLPDRCTPLCFVSFALGFSRMLFLHSQLIELLLRLVHKFAQKQLDEKAVDLLRKLLTMDPAKRISAGEALDHDWFWHDPMPCDPSW